MKNLLRHRISVFAILIFFMTSLFLFSQCTKEADQIQTQKYFPSIDNNADLYLHGSYDILHMIKIRELGKIGRATKIAAQRKLAGGRIHSYIWTPHIMYGGACCEDVPGNPNIAPDYKSGHPKFRQLPDDLGAGDFLIVAGTGRQEARKRGCYFLGIGYPMSTNRYSPLMFNDHPETAMESQVDMMIYTWGPKEDGLVTPRLTPHLKICPTSPMTVLGYWLVMAQLAHNLAYNDTSGQFDAAATYIDTLMNRLSLFHERYIGAVNEIGPEMADRILSGGKIYPWSSRWEFYQEASGTAGTVMGIYPIHPDGIYTGPGMHKPPKFNPDDVTEKDIVLLAMAGDTPEVEVEMARTLREKGAFIVGVYPFEREDGFSTEPLKTLCDYSLDNLSGDLHGVLDIEGYDTKIIPTMALMNNYAYWAIIGAYVQAMEARNAAPYYWMSWHVPGGKAYTDSIHSYFLDRGY